MKSTLSATLAIACLSLAGSPQDEKERPFEAIGSLVKPEAGEKIPDGAQTHVVFVPDGKKERVYVAVPKLWVNEFQPGIRAWIKGGFGKGGFVFVTDRVFLPRDGAKSIRRHAENKSVSIDVTKVFPWCDHQPVLDPKTNRHLLVGLRLENRTDKPLTVVFQKAFVSTREDAEGDAFAEMKFVDGVSIPENPKEKRGGGTRVTLNPGETLKIELEGTSAFAEGLHGKMLYVTVAFRANDEFTVVRGNGNVQDTH